MKWLIKISAIYFVFTIGGCTSIKSNQTITSDSVVERGETIAISLAYVSDFYLDRYGDIEKKYVSIPKRP